MEALRPHRAASPRTIRW